MWSIGYSCQILIKLEFSQQISEIYSNFMKIRRVAAEMYHADGKTDVYDESNIRFSQFCSRA